MTTGDTRERELVNELREEDYPALRMPSSGAGTKRELPDILIRADGHIIAGELKYTSNDTAVVRPDELEDLRTFAARWKMVPAAIGRFSYDTDFYVVPLRGDRFKKEVTKSGYLRMKRDRRDRYYELYRYLSIVERATT